MQLVTSARFCEVNGRGREAYERPTARETQQTARWSRRAGRFDHDLHGDGLLKFQGGAHELFHLTAIISQLLIALAVGQVKVFEAGEFNLEFCNLFDGEMGVAGLWFTSEHLADEEREVAAAGKHGLVHDLNWQSVAKHTARD